MSTGHSKAGTFAKRGLVFGILAGAVIAAAIPFLPASLVIFGVSVGPIIGHSILGGVIGGLSGCIGGGILGSFFKNKDHHNVENTRVMSRNAPNVTEQSMEQAPSVSHQNRITLERETQHAGGNAR